MALTVRQIEAALRATSGNISKAAKQLNITRWGLQKRINRNAQLQEVVAESREELVDLAEDRLRENVDKGDMTAIIWTLKANPAAKARGWSERHEVTGANGGAIQHEDVTKAADRILGKLDGLAARAAAGTTAAGAGPDADRPGGA